MARRKAKKPFEVTPESIQTQVVPQNTVQHENVENVEIETSEPTYNTEPGETTVVISDQGLIDENQKLKSEIDELKSTLSTLIDDGYQKELELTRQLTEEKEKTDHLINENDRLGSLNEELILKNSELSFENTRLEAINATISERCDKSTEKKIQVDNPNRRVYTMETDRKAKPKNYSYISTNGYESWN